jgi:hypothetical protein
MNESACQTSDLAAQRIAFFLWGFPALCLLAGLLWPEGRVWLWTPALIVAGTACLLNAARCGRLHCYFTGPLFLLAAAAKLLRHLGITPIRWNWILWALLVGTLPAHVPEWIHGKYVKFKTRGKVSL